MLNRPQTPSFERELSGEISNPKQNTAQEGEFAERYDIRLWLVRAALDNCHDEEAPPDAHFHVIGPMSPDSWQQAVEKLGQYFQREFRYDSPPYEALEFDHYGAKYWDDRVVVFSQDTFDSNMDEALIFVGAVGFRRGYDETSNQIWILSWAWFHPYERRKGELTRAWPILNKMFPGFKVSPPSSPAMKSFLSKVGYKI
jgi:hypothetical protein